jgi:asparagine synthase (glutamine-hydrolysing)
VLWDPNRHQYLLAVDPIGVQPLFWARCGSGRLVVSSWLDRLLDESGVDTSLDVEAVLWDRRVGLRVESFLDRTHFESVRKLPWGRVLHLPPGGEPRLSQYWNPRDLPGPDRRLTLGDAAELLRDRVDEAIRRLLPDDPAVVVGSHVSSGLDCTSIACRASALLRERGRGLRAGYSWSPSDAEQPRVAGDERDLLDLVSTRHGFPVRRLPPVTGPDWYDGVDPHRYVPATIQQERLVLPVAAADGIDLMLSGWGGDELASFNGRMVVNRLVRRGRLATARRVVDDRITLTADGPVGLRRRLRHFGGAVFEALPDSARAVRHPRRAALERSHQAAVESILAEVSPVVAELERERRRSLAAVRDHHDLQLLLLTNGHLQHRTTWWHQAGHRFDLRYRYPLLDLDVVTAALSLPWWAYLDQGWRRVAYRTAVAPWVPAEIAWNMNKSEPSRFGDDVRRLRPEPPVPVGDVDRLVAAVAERLDALPGRAARRIEHAPVRARPEAAPAIDPVHPVESVEPVVAAGSDDWSVLPEHLGLHVTVGPVPDEIPGADRPVSWVQTTRTMTRVGFGPHNALLVADGRDVRVQWQLDEDETGADPGWVVQGWAVTLAMLHRGRLSLHASTVRLRSGEVIAVAGRQGAGKSTTAMGLRARGHTLLVDDTTILDLRDDGAWITPYTRNVHLLPDAAAALGVDFAALPPLAGRFGKSSFRPEDSSIDPVRLDRVVVLQAVDSAVLTRVVVRGASRTELLRRHVWRRGVAPLVLGQEAFFGSLTRLAHAVDVVVVGRPANSWTLDSVLDAIEQPI